VTKIGQHSGDVGRASTKISSISTLERDP